MEDRYTASFDVDRNPNLVKSRAPFHLHFYYRAEIDKSGTDFFHQAFFGIYDGHGGATAAEFTAQKLGKNVMAELEERNEEKEFGYEIAIRTGYLKTDEEFSEKKSSGGTCCVTAVIKNGDLIVSNAGDCRGVISIRGDAEALTSDHRPSREDERSRIENLVILFSLGNASIFNLLSDF